MSGQGGRQPFVYKDQRPGGEIDPRDKPISSLTVRDLKALLGQGNELSEPYPQTGPKTPWSEKGGWNDSSPSMDHLADRLHRLVKSVSDLQADVNAIKENLGNAIREDLG